MCYYLNISVFCPNVNFFFNISSSFFISSSKRKMVLKFDTLHKCASLLTHLEDMLSWYAGMVMFDMKTKYS